MAKFFDKDGKEIEAFTQEELDAQKAQALEEYKKANPDKSDEIARLTEELRIATEKAAGGAGDEAQKRRLKQEKEDAEKALDEKVAALKKEFDEYKNGITSSAKETILGKLVGADKDLRAKVELKMNNLTGYPDTPEGTAQKIQDAYTMATGTRPTPSMMDGITSAGGRGEGSGNDGNKGGMTENGKLMAKAIGVSDDSIKKYSEADIAKAQGKPITN
jgi:hypothetical protein